MRSGFLGIAVLFFAAQASATGGGPPFEYEVRTVSDAIRSGYDAVASPSGRFVAWREGSVIRLHDLRRNETRDLPGPANVPDVDRVHLHVSDTHVVWRRAESDAFSSTELYLHDIRKGTTVEVYQPSTPNDPPILLGPRWLVWEGRVEIAPDVLRSHVLAYEIRTGTVHDLTPGNLFVGWLDGDGERIAWVQGPVVDNRVTQDATVTHDLRSGRTEVLDSGPGGRQIVDVAGNTVVWTFGDSRELRVATLRFRSCDDPGWWALAPFVGLAGWRVRREARRTDPGDVPA